METRVCLLCRIRCEAIILPRVELLELINQRDPRVAFRHHVQPESDGSLDACLLHHHCQQGNARPLSKTDSWFACQEPERPLDELAVFELLCDACRARAFAADP